MTDFELAGRVPDHGLEYPGFSTVFIQTFSIRSEKKFRFPDKYRKSLPDGEDMLFDKERKIYVENADALGIPIAPMDNAIETQIFVMPDNDGPDERNIRRFSLRGFDFDMTLKPDKKEGENFPPIRMRCHVNVELSLFFGHTVSLTYRFLFNGKQGVLSRNATTDHIIMLLSTYLGAEFWSMEKEGTKKTNINFETGFKISDFHYDAQGNPLDKGIDLDFFGKGRTFDEIATRYKRFIYEYCAKFDGSVGLKERLANKKRFSKIKIESSSDNHYAMVDLWENIMHPLPGSGVDYFSKESPEPLTEGQIVAHIHECHKAELIGLMSLYPEEWLYRDPEAFDEVCGENIAIDTDDLVLANHKLCMVLGTYGRRGGDEDDDESHENEEGLQENADDARPDEEDIQDNNEESGSAKGVNWAEHLKERAIYHVSWPEYLVILQMILAKKYVIARVNEELVNSTLAAGKESAYDLIGKNARLSIRLSQVLMLLDVVKYCKFTSHMVMFDRTKRRLELDVEMERLKEMMEMVDSSLHNLSDHKAMNSDLWLNFIMGIISAVSTFELFFQDSEMPFLKHFGYETESFAAILVAVVFGITFFALLLLVAKGIKQSFIKLGKYL